MSEALPRLIGPQATALLLAVHAVRQDLVGETDDTRHLTQLLAATAGVPTMAAAWRLDMPLPDEDVMRAVRTGLTEHRVLYIHHMQQDGEVRRLHVEPYHVRLEAGCWYLIARLADEKTERVLRMDKIVSAAAEREFTPQPVDLDRYLGGVFVPADPGATARVRFGSRSAIYAQERWGTGAVADDGGSVELVIPYQREHFFVRLLAEFGDDYEVLAPASLRAGIRARAEATLAFYDEAPPEETTAGEASGV
jgi:predicted DNA-binding transcriptional regulator YafY